MKIINSYNYSSKGLNKNKKEKMFLSNISKTNNTHFSIRFIFVFLWYF
jgi:hypothetical protein